MAALDSQPASVQLIRLFHKHPKPQAKENPQFIEADFQTSSVMLRDSSVHTVCWLCFVPARRSQSLLCRSTSTSSWTLRILRGDFQPFRVHCLLFVPRTTLTHGKLLGAGVRTAWEVVVNIRSNRDIRLAHARTSESRIRHSSLTATEPPVLYQLPHGNWAPRVVSSSHPSDGRHLFVVLGITTQSTTHGWTRKLRSAVLSLSDTITSSLVTTDPAGKNILEVTGSLIQCCYVRVSQSPTNSVYSIAFWSDWAKYINNKSKRKLIAWRYSIQQTSAESPT
jgi:hypothetical protein